MLYKLYQKQVEAWKERFGGQHIEDAYDNLLSSRQKDTIELIEAEIERKKGMRKKTYQYEHTYPNEIGLMTPTGYQKSISKGQKEIMTSHLEDDEIAYNKFIDEDIAYLEEELRKLKNEQ